MGWGWRYEMSGLFITAAKLCLLLCRRFDTCFDWQFVVFRKYWLNVKCVCTFHAELISTLSTRRVRKVTVQGGSNMTGTDLYVNKPHCAAAVRP